MIKPTKPNPLEVIDTGSDAKHSPFEVSVITDNTVVVNYYSSLLQNMDIRNFIPILGLDQEFTLNYGDKIYLEIYFDQNSVPISARIRHDSRWWKAVSLKKTTSGSLVAVKTYPSELEIISSLDLTNKIQEIQNDIVTAYNEATTAVNEVNADLAAGNISSTDASAQIAKINKDRDSYTASMRVLQTSISKFFSGGKLNGKQQLKAYKLIANTTKDASSSLSSKIIIPDKVTTGKDPFYMVQCLKNDLMLVDYCYNNVGCKLPIPWSRPIYYYADEKGNTEDSVNTNV